MQCTIPEQTRNVSIGHRCLHFSTFVTKLKIFKQTDGQKDNSKWPPLPLKNGGIKNISPYRIIIMKYYYEKHVNLPEVEEMVD